MNEQRFETGSAPHVTVNECVGTLVVGSWKGTAVLARGFDFNGTAESIDQISLSSAGDLTLTVPEKASLTVEMVQGALTVKHVDGIINVSSAVANIALNDVGSVKIGRVDGRLQGENMNGPLALNEAGQDVTLRNVADVGIKKAAGSVSIHYANGAVLLEKIEGDATLHTISGDLIIRQGAEASLSNLGGKNEVGGIGGALRLVGGLVNGEHHFASKGDMYVAWPPDAPVTLIAAGALIDNQLSLTNATETAENGQTRLTGHIENGKPIVSLKTEANMGLKPLRTGEKAAPVEADFDFTPPPPTLAEIVGTAVRTHLTQADQAQIDQIVAAINGRLAAHNLTLMTPPETAVAPPPPSAGKVAAQKAQRDAEKSLHKARETMAQAQAKLSAPSPEPTAKTTLTTPKSAPVPETEPVTAVQPSQTQILKLLKDEMITIEQANTLLNQLPKT